MKVTFNGYFYKEEKKGIKKAIEVFNSYFNISDEFYFNLNSISKHEISNLNNNSKVFNSKAQKIIISNETIDFKKPIANQIIKILYKRNIISATVEGGAKTLNTFLNENIWDEIRKFKSPLNFKNGTKAPEINIKPKNKTLIIEDELVVIYNNN